MRIFIVASIISALSGCAWLPVPWQSSEPRFTTQQLDAIQASSMDREGLNTYLGNADVHRDTQKVWIYGWGQSHGRQYLSGDWTPLYYSYHVLIVEFDDSGIVVRKTVVEAGAARGGPACTPGGLCVEGQWTKELPGFAAVHVSDDDPVSTRLDESTTIVYRMEHGTRTPLSQ